MSCIVSLLAHLSVAHACASFSGHEAVPITREDALIVWDAAKHEEHFIRSAVWGTKQKSVGFLVPTPSQPTFADASDRWISSVAALTTPPVEHQARFVPIGCTMVPFMFMARSMKGATTAAAHSDGVRVLDQTRVAGMDVTVLDATDAGALAKWLGAHDFELRPSLERWLAPYVAKKWMISAFRYARPDLASNAADDVAPSIASRAVSITFKTDAPVYPYREPDDAPPVPGRELHLFVLANARLDAAESDLANAPWPAPVQFAAKIAPPAELGSIGVRFGDDLWLHEIVDRVDKRPATDLVFDKSASASELRPPPRIIEDGPRIWVPYELPFVALGVWLWRRRRKRLSPRP